MRNNGDKDWNWMEKRESNELRERNSENQYILRRLK